jgi:2-oxoglutarate ferredoxin oxidoreductase subunit delta
MRLWRKPFDQTETDIKSIKVIIKTERCKGCSFCVEFCPRGVLEMAQEMNERGYLIPKVSDETKCLGCGLCEVICPDFVINIIPRDEKE